MQPRLRKLACSTAVAVAFACGASVVQAQTAAPAQSSPPQIQSGQDLEQIFQEANELNKLAQASQERIEDTASETQRLLRDFQAVLRQIESLKAYNAQQRRVVADQEEQLAELQQSINDVVSIRREITPLMLRMIDRLEEFVALDVPFLHDKRTQRVANLRDFMDQSNISPSEKFRLVLEAYQIENEFGRTIESYRGALEIDGQERQVDFLRIGRVVLAYQTLDGQLQGRWNQETKAWEALGAEYSGSIDAAMRFAKKQAAPQMYLLPVSGPKQSKEQTDE